MNSPAVTKFDSAQHFPVIEVTGTARMRGRGHGEALASRIKTTLDFYLDDLFAGTHLSRDQIRQRALRVREIGQRYAPTVNEEILGISEGAGLEAWQVFALNARTEILNARVDECSALYFADHGVLGQNWDWIEPLEALCVVVRHRQADGFEHITFCEPGMVGKIGMNSGGVGVCLNILFAPHDLSGLPVHMLIGQLLASRDFEQAHRTLAQCGLGKASHLLVAARGGRAVSAEFYGDELHLLEPKSGVLLHTNHCVALGAAGRREDLANSCARYDRLVERIGQVPGRDVSTAKSILLSLDGGEDSIMRPYRPQNVLGNHAVGSCASIIMELESGRFHVKRGPGDEDNYQSLALATAA